MKYLLCLQVLGMVLSMCLCKNVEQEDYSKVPRFWGIPGTRELCRGSPSVYDKSVTNQHTQDLIVQPLYLLHCLLTLACILQHFSTIIKTVDQCLFCKDNVFYFRELLAWYVCKGTIVIKIQACMWSLLPSLYIKRWGRNDGMCLCPSFQLCGTDVLALSCSLQKARQIAPVNLQSFLPVFFIMHLESFV